ncbi:uncharacterized protein LOC131006110 isoform X2 [Salvia miltiorrhiza]|uniref:uncharacterized protein LOC131006110 isoform X2 n=1 Tax=Salvia miltiorrhiza TaxID=226208 RepID=UPI0025ACE3FC|nr:uncharacterized protein LOC131006110 isoform X2 [Salvia miltiorrhiza]
MAISHSASDLRVNRVKVLRMVLVLVGLLMICCVERHSKKYSAALALSCSPCSCDCVSDTTLMSLPSDCGKDDPETRDEMKKDMIALLTEEISLHANVTGDSLQRTNVLITSAKRASSHFQKEANKCIAGVETCEAARERAGAALIEERKLTALWMSRAQDYGWKDDMNNMNEIL